MLEQDSTLSDLDAAGHDGSKKLPLVPPFERSDDGVSVNLRSHQHETDEVSPASEQLEPDQPSAMPEASPVPVAIDESVYATTDLPEGHRIDTTSEWLNIELDKAGHAVEDPIQAYGQEFHRERRQENPAELQYEYATEPAGEEDEKEVAVGQLAVSTLGEETESAGRRSSGSNSGYEDSIMAAAGRITDAAQDIRQKISSFTAFDVALWAILFLIIVTIIFAIQD